MAKTKLKKMLADIDKTTAETTPVKVDANQLLEHTCKNATLQAVSNIALSFDSIGKFAMLVRSVDDNSEAISKIIASSAIDLTQEYEKDKPVIAYDNQPFATLQNFSQVIGLPKSRKSWFVQMVGGRYLKAQLGKDCSKDKLQAYKLQGVAPLLVIDTEQGNYRASKMANTIAKLAEAEAEELKELLHVHSMRKNNPYEILVATETLIILHKPKLVIIDGIADLMTDPNDTNQSALIREFLLRASAEYDCHIMCVIHDNNSGLNTTDPKSRGRGHLGSDLERKSEANIYIKKPNPESENSNVSFTGTRDKTPTDFSFFVHDNLPYEAEFVSTTKADKDNETIITIMRSEQKAEWERQELITTICEKLNISEMTARRRIKQAQESGFIETKKVGKIVFYSVNE